MQKVPKYIVVDFNGERPWMKLNDGSYAVDSLYLEFFLKVFN